MREIAVFARVSRFQQRIFTGETKGILAPTYSGIVDLVGMRVLSYDFVARDRLRKISPSPDDIFHQVPISRHVPSREAL